MTSFSNTQYLQQLRLWGATNKQKKSTETATIIGTLLLGIAIGMAITKLLAGAKAASPISKNETSDFTAKMQSDMEGEILPPMQEIDESPSTSD